MDCRSVCRCWRPPGHLLEAFKPRVVNGLRQISGDFASQLRRVAGRFVPVASTGRQLPNPAAQPEDQQHRTDDGRRPRTAQRPQHREREQRGEREGQQPEQIEGQRHVTRGVDDRLLDRVGEEIAISGTVELRNGYLHLTPRDVEFPADDEDWATSAP